MNSTTTDKIWGSSTALLVKPTFEVHRIEFNKGYKCSEHRHEYKVNYFYVESGKLLIRLWPDLNSTSTAEEIILVKGDSIHIAANKIHQFEGLEDGIAFEIYWPEFFYDDIIRRTIGSKV
jgi:quercetin dioxygenase-like cupin family protein